MLTGSLPAALFLALAVSTAAGLAPDTHTAVAQQAHATYAGPAPWNCPDGQPAGRGFACSKPYTSYDECEKDLRANPNAIDYACRGLAEPNKPFPADTPWESGPPNTHPPFWFEYRDPTPPAQPPAADSPSVSLA